MSAVCPQPPSTPAGPWTLGALLGADVDAGPAAGIPVAGLALDSRRLRPGEVFFALAGSRDHGLRHLEQAHQAGAAAVVLDAGRPPASCPLPAVCLPGLAGRLSAIAGRFHGQPSRALQVVGVTGTNGKSTVAHLLAHALDGAPGRGRCATLGTLGCGFPGALTPDPNTTPDAFTVQRVLAGARDAGADAAVCEVSSHALVQHRVEAVHFEVAAFTNLSRDHLDYHGSESAYAAAKRRLFELPGLGAAVVNADDPRAGQMLDALAPGARRVGCTLRGEPAALPPVDALLRLRALEASARGLRLELDTPAGPARLESPLLGRFNAANLLIALGVLLELGLPLDSAVQRLAAVPPAPGRMECHGGGTAPLTVIDYAHSPDALEQALRTLRDLGPGRLWCVFGCGGERDRGKRAPMGRIAEALADQVVLTSDNPRGEAPEAIAADILVGMQRPAAVCLEPDRARAIAAAVAGAAPGDIVLVAGKGHEDYQDRGGRRLAFSDREQVLRALAGRGQG